MEPSLETFEYVLGEPNGRCYTFQRSMVLNHKYIEGVCCKPLTVSYAKLDMGVDAQARKTRAQIAHLEEVLKPKAVPKVVPARFAVPAPYFVAPQPQFPQPMHVPPPPKLGPKPPDTPPPFCARRQNRAKG